MLGPRALLARLDQALDFAAAHDHARQRTLRQTIAWSEELLDEQHRRLFRRLGVFAGGCDLAAVAAVCELSEENQALALVSGLLDSSLVTVAEDLVGEPRIGLLETVHAYVRDQLVSHGEWEALQARHATCFLELAMSLRSALQSRQQQPETRARFEVEHDNFRQAPAGRSARRSATNVRPTRLPRRLRWACGCASRWRPCGTSPATSPGSAVAMSLPSTAPVAVTVPSSRGASPAWVPCCTSRTTAWNRRRGSKQAAADMWRRLDDRNHLSFALTSLGGTLAELGQPGRARVVFDEALHLAQTSGDEGLLSWAFGYVAYFEQCERHLDRSLALYDEALDNSRAIGDPRRVWLFTMGQACVWRLQGRLDLALTAMQALIPAGLEFNDPQTLAVIAETYAALLADLHQHRDAAFLLGAADATRDHLATSRLPLLDREISEAMAASRAALSGEEWDRVYRSGWGTVVQEALKKGARAGRVDQPPAGLQAGSEGRRGSVALTDRTVAVRVAR